MNVFIINCDGAQKLGEILEQISRSQTQLQQPQQQVQQHHQEEEETEKEYDDINKKHINNQLKVDERIKNREMMKGKKKEINKSNFKRSRLIYDDDGNDEEIEMKRKKAKREEMLIKEEGVNTKKVTEEPLNDLSILALYSLKERKRGRKTFSKWEHDEERKKLLETFGESFFYTEKQALDKNVEEGLIERTNKGRYSLTDDGIAKAKMIEEFFFD